MASFKLVEFKKSVRTSLDKEYVPVIYLFFGRTKYNCETGWPVCSLSSLSKIIENVINNRVVNFPDDNKNFRKTKFGSRKNIVLKQHY